MSCKKVVSFFLLLSITTTFLLSCNKYDKNNITKETENVATETTEWTFDKLVQESDCCVMVCRREAFDENGVAFSEYVDGKYYIEIWVNTLCERDRELFPEKITIIQDEPILDTPTKTGFNVDSFVFLTKTKQKNFYILTGNKSGVIRTNYKKLEPMDDNLKRDMRQKFKNNYNNFADWLKNEYAFSDIMYETTESSDTETISENAIYTSPNNS